MFQEVQVVQVVATEAGKRFRWRANAEMRIDSLLSPDSFPGFSYFSVMRGFQQVDQGTIIQPQNNRPWFGGLGALMPLTGPYFSHMAAETFHSGDAIEFFDAEPHLMAAE